MLYSQMKAGENFCRNKDYLRDVGLESFYITDTIPTHISALKEYDLFKILPISDIITYVLTGINIELEDDYKEEERPEE